MKKAHHHKIRSSVRENYGKVASSETTGCSSSSPSCCGVQNEGAAAKISLQLGYSSAELSAVPAGANLGLGCGNPQAIAGLKAGETVLDLGSGAGFDCFLAARAVGEKGHVFGIDMTHEMMTKARANAEKAGFGNVEFRLGEIEHLPVADGTIDVIISNCVVNLSPEKEQVFRDSFRVLKRGGRLAISDVVATAEMPDSIKNDMSLYCACASGASSIQEIEAMLERVGFEKIRIQPKDESKEFIRDWAPGAKLEDYVVSATIEAWKPV